jgi:hypothetical protein
MHPSRAMLPLSGSKLRLKEVLLGSRRPGFLPVSPHDYYMGGASRLCRVVVLLPARDAALQLLESLSNLFVSLSAAFGSAMQLQWASISSFPEPSHLPYLRRLRH